MAVGSVEEVVVLEAQTVLAALPVEQQLHKFAVPLVFQEEFDIDFDQRTFVIVFRRYKKTIRNMSMILDIEDMTAWCLVYFAWCHSF